MSGRTLLAVMFLLVGSASVGNGLRAVPPSRPTLAPTDARARSGTEARARNGTEAVPYRAVEAKRPNVLWLTCEDMSCNLGCYGDRDAKTPNLDAFAKQAIRYDHAFSGAGVCAPSRSTLILGAYATSFGSHYMRCQAPLPDGV